MISQVSLSSKKNYFKVFFFHFLVGNYKLISLVFLVAQSLFLLNFKKIRKYTYIFLKSLMKK